MFVELVCGCGASFQLDGPDESNTATWLLTNRFSEAHVACGFMTPIAKDAPETTERYTLKFKPRPRIYHEDDPEE